MIDEEEIQAFESVLRRCGHPSLLKDRVETIYLLIFNREDPGIDREVCASFAGEIVTTIGYLALVIGVYGFPNAKELSQNFDNIKLPPYDQ